MEPKQKQNPVVDVTGDRSKVQCCKEQYSVGTWTVRSMNQGKLEVVKQEMARVNVDILGISELKWTEMGEFNSGDHYIYYCGQESLRRNGVAIMVNKRVRNAVLGCNLKNDRIDLCSFPRKTIQYQSNPSLCPNQECWRSWSCRSMKTYMTFENYQLKKRSFLFKWLECKSRKSRDTWSNRQIWPWSTKWGKAKPNRVLPREHTGHNKHPLPTT